MLVLTTTSNQLVVPKDKPLARASGFLLCYTPSPHIFFIQHFVHFAFLLTNPNSNNEHLIKQKIICSQIKTTQIIIKSN